MLTRETQISTNSKKLNEYEDMTEGTCTYLINTPHMWHHVPKELKHGIVLLFILLYLYFDITL